ncbi:expressed unknown protein [Seminavis robusta]|uniref:Uncharacterized protein n=1 Tax=Seminavis robusta TaxID=568900 RepID=A0A9N8HBH4_9STRA|nr:expressed unknown protein [Seminavis robusta]|eukprot:Sro183_g079640.1 n/a (187) ;mRNA; f:36400-36960
MMLLKKLNPLNIVRTTCTKRQSMKAGRGLLKPVRKRGESSDTCETTSSSSSFLDAPFSGLDHDDAMNASFRNLVSVVEAYSTATPTATASNSRPRQRAPARREDVQVAIPARIPLAHPMRLHSHRRSKALCEHDYQELMVQSRGWLYDAADLKTQPQHHKDRLRNRALTEDDFDRYIFAPRAVHAV